LAYDIEITKEFRFDAAHCLPNMPDGHMYRRLHGHSFRVEVSLDGTPDPRLGWIADFTEIDRVLAGIAAELDHTTLNETPGLENPTLEVIGAWIFERAVQRLPGVTRVTIHRDSIGERCTIRRRAA
jgi:6-pyruvoyltetrahydropterin/6-carboxytetrahydropterin synthase